MSYIAIDLYSKKWIFTHASMPIPEDDLAQIKPMSPLRSAQFWKDNVSAQSPDADRFGSDDWAYNKKNWGLEESWMNEWESDDSALPIAISEHIDWQDDVTVYFCYEKYNVIETKWSIFKRHWKNFLFYDDGPILIGRRREQVLWFNSKGRVKLGRRAIASA
jgi:hypothetical protein